MKLLTIVTALTTLAFSAFAMDGSNFDAVKRAVSEENIRRSCSNVMTDFRDFIREYELKRDIQEFLGFSPPPSQSAVSIEREEKNRIGWGPYKGKLTLKAPFFTGTHRRSDATPSTL